MMLETMTLQVMGKGKGLEYIIGNGKTAIVLTMPRVNVTLFDTKSPSYERKT